VDTDRPASGQMSQPAPSNKGLYPQTSEGRETNVKCVKNFYFKCQGHSLALTV